MSSNQHPSDHFRTASSFPPSSTPAPKSTLQVALQNHRSSRRSSRSRSTLSEFALSPDPHTWGINLSPRICEPDDHLHTPDLDHLRTRQDAKPTAEFFSARAMVNVGCLFVTCVGLLVLFLLYPILTHFTIHRQGKFGGFNLGGINASGQVPSISGNWGLIDSDTPLNLHTKPSYHDPSQTLQLVFSDEFNTDGRSFYPGDDPYWEAADLHYWQTNNLEWYDPAAITTSNGSLLITLSEQQTHGLNFQGGLLSTWNKFCFTGGLLETSVQLPGANNVVGLWPAVWALGNLGRAGYGATLEGLWPYSYDACDVGTAPNQTLNGLPLAALTSGDQTYFGGSLSYLPGQKLSRCTCPGESHPGPTHSDGTFVGRSAPEIDVFEAAVLGTPLVGKVSQSSQWAPFNNGYMWANTSQNMIIPNTTGTELNVYVGGVTQQSTSGLTITDQGCYESEGGCFSTYGFEYKPGPHFSSSSTRFWGSHFFVLAGFDSAYITWISNSTVSWTIMAAGMDADTTVEISARPVSQEPMYLIANLGLSNSFGKVDLEHLTFPTTMRIDWIRVYQPTDAINIGCDPVDFPTQAYINQYIEAYTNPNLTTWRDDYKQPWPKNSFVETC
ncbi:glycoside hydrolase family 16 protein [Laccaria amethystina LaAM-08-1]|uniref:Glycoside hydrolase family 16 protein n=1 Tax=Laccaria amethystina LaAM-08-1 TaxID=1095629 RepID=A0A0C9XK66_9AGAR|nr:glycoside hydrolase family 16 protein [Laccaria amethystina LaAM-08-1]